MKSSLLGGSLCDVTNFATEVASKFPLELFLQLWSLFEDLLLSESVDLHGIAGGGCSSGPRLFVVFLVREAKQ